MLTSTRPAALSPSEGRVNGAAYPDLSASPPPEPLLVAPPPRDQSTNRGRAQSAASQRTESPRNGTPSASSQGRGKSSIDLERKPSYGHHRQTSIVNGVRHAHSRNPSLLTPASSPLSPARHITGPNLDGVSQGQNGTPQSPALAQVVGPNITALPQSRTFDINATQRRIPERMHSGRMKRSHEQQGASLRNQPTTQEPRTVGEYALHHLFTSFIADANHRIEKCLHVAGQPQQPIEPIIGPGVDPAFDQLIWSLGHINRHKPASLIDSIIRWRKEKADYAALLYEELRDMRAWPHGHMGRSPNNPPTVEEILAHEQKFARADQYAKVSIYVICRVFIEVISQTTSEALNGSGNTLQTIANLEELIYGHLHAAEPDTLANSPVIRANWTIRAELLGVMSTFRFQEVSKRFVRDLRVIQEKLSVKNNTYHEVAKKTSLLIQGMRWLKVQYEPDSAWEKSCETLHTLARFFVEVRGRTMKHAYAELFESLMIPVAANATTQLGLPKWKETLSLLQPKLVQMLSKADHWPYVYPLQAVLLCVSPLDYFANQWLQLAVSSQPRARDRSARSHALKAICRLVWRYLYRCSDSGNSISRKLEEVVKIVFQGGKRVLVSTDPIIADPLIQLIRIIGFQQQDFCFRHIIFPLMNADLFLSGTDRELKIENLDPEKMVIAIRAFLALMGDLEKGETPSFPMRFECDALLDPTSRSLPMHRRTRSQGFALSAGRTERLSRPMLTSSFNDITKEYYVKFCKILAKLTMICDNTFGGQAVLDEKFSTHTPKTPMAEAFAFARSRDETVTANDLRQNYYDLFHVAVEALPRCMSPHLPINLLVNLLCTGTAHVQSHIATSSAQSLKSIARQSYAQQVTIGFARFIFNFDDRYATVSDGSLLGPGHIESTLKLYVELLEIWIDDIQQRTRKAVADPSEDQDQGVRPLPLDLSGVLAHVDEVESHGLFFLCSPSRAVRAVAVNVLRLISKFDIALGKPSTRIISILEGSSEAVIDVDDERLSLAERSRLMKGLRKSNVTGTLVELCSSDIAHDEKLWFKIFPNLVRLSAEICLHAVALTRELVCQRLSHSSKTIGIIGEGQKPPSMANGDANNSRMPTRLTSSSPEIIIEQWKIHLIFACTTLTNVGSTPSQSSMAVSSTHVRKSSKSSAAGSDKMSSAAELFSSVVRFLSVPEAAVRAAAVAGLGATRATLFHTLIEVLRPYMADCNSDAKERLASHSRTTSNPRVSRRRDFLRTEITHLLALTCPVLQEPSVQCDDDTLGALMEFTRQLRLFLNDVHIQGEVEYQKLRTHFCSLVESLYAVVSKRKDGLRWMSFQSRQACFALMEDWSGFLPNSVLVRQQEHFRRSILDREGDMRNRVIINSTIEKGRNELMFAAISAMATMCAGPLTFVADNKLLMEFDLTRLLKWIQATFEAASDRVHAIGRKALQNLISSNPEELTLMAQAIRMCYVAKMPKALASYFAVVTKVLMDTTAVNVPFWRVVCVALYTLGNDNSEIRMKSMKLLRTEEERQGKTSKLQELDISVTDRTTTVYKNAQFEISRRLASQHMELAFHVFSEFSAYFNELEPDHKRNMVLGMLPWIQTIQLQLTEQNGGPTATSHMLLVNLFEITVRSSPTLHNEIQALWQALATGPFPMNVQVVLDFVIDVCLERREQNFVNYAKQVVVFLSKTPAGSRVIEYLLKRISSKDLACFRSSRPRKPPVDVSGLPYVADLSEVLPFGVKQTGMSMSQVCMILLVDLVVAPFQLPPEKIPTLLQVILTQWDQYTEIVQDNAHELLVHLMHELVISKIDPESTEMNKQSIDNFIDSVRSSDPKILWTYNDHQVRPGEEQGRAVSDQLYHVVDKVVRIFSLTYPNIRADLGRTTMEWATSCPVRHVACRSFQIYRCLSIPLTRQMLVDMLAQLSSFVTDDEHEGIRVFSLQILTTIRFVLDDTRALPDDALPNIFWVTVACLDTIFEAEYQEVLSILDVLLRQICLADEDGLHVLRERRPADWAGEFHGLHPLLYKGIRSSKSMDRSLQIMEKLMQQPSNDIIGNDDRLLFTIYANLPRFLRSFDNDGRASSCSASAEVLAAAAENQNLINLARVLQGFAKGRYRSEKDFLSQCLTAIRHAYYPAQELPSLTFLLGMVNNETDWVKAKTMQILCVLLPEINLRKPEIASQGPDLISPLLRLLTTPYCHQALDVLDNVIEMTGTPMDHKHLRMSMLGSHSSRAVRKEYDTTKSLYGIPEDSGWSIPMPAICASTTRSNVHKVFTMMAQGLQGDSMLTPTPDAQFFRDDDTFESYFNDRTATMMSDEARESTLGELAEKLDTLDDFFDDEPSSPVDDLPSMGWPMREDVYDQQALPILHRSLQRNASVTSFTRGFAGEYRSPQQQSSATFQPFAGATTARPPPREVFQPPAMNPAAFLSRPFDPTWQQPPPQRGTSLHRPSVQNRSITSPILGMLRGPASAREPPTNLHEFLSGDEAEHSESFSDDDASTGRALAREESFSSFNTVGSVQSHHHAAKSTGGGSSLKAGLRSGIRRLTTTSSGGREARDAIRAAGISGPVGIPGAVSVTKSPRVPRVPAAFTGAGLTALPPPPGVVVPSNGTTVAGMLNPATNVPTSSITGAGAGIE